MDYKIAVLRAPGTNCDYETAYCVESLGMKPGKMFPVVDGHPDALQGGRYLPLVNSSNHQLGIPIERLRMVRLSHDSTP